ncbi:nucleotidyltransferase domain-containing protein [Heliobacterium gestii]|uniref:Nucleotidyltransferase domain-containing protein n=1 Tax=Heliomicrobium gestii TaxID=2699 RepID=A0A845LGX8_HELGE|nr:nucleotidyltransferase domain-containing protein [Heliomicrobium gestii]MBM7867411.1 putative nucleotidyltransferase [Heliomicrobium gestii]MZP43675.1 nucleotidyltransferase domain-containing protein [Heliomicrobium gestii]
MKKERERFSTIIDNILKDNLGSYQVKVFFFGSWSRFEERPSSDIDIAIWAEEPLPLGTLARLRAAFEDSPLPYPVDVVDLTNTETVFREHVMREGIPWNA